MLKLFPSLPTSPPSLCLRYRLNASQTAPCRETLRPSPKGYSVLWGSDSGDIWRRLLGRSPVFSLGRSQDTDPRKALLYFMWRVSSGPPRVPAPQNLRPLPPVKAG